MSAATHIQTAARIRVMPRTDEARDVATAQLPLRSSAPLPFSEQTTTSWGRVKRQRSSLATPAFLDQIPRVLSAEPDRKLLGLGLGRSYGDSCLNEGGALIDMTALDRVVAFDPITGIIRAEAGLSLSELLRIVVPHGWFLPTTPGTRFVTLGGAIANDVHGKNHHAAGTLGSSVRRLCLHTSTIGAREISPSVNAELFRATIAGLGLTGLIAWVELQLVRIPGAFLGAENVAFSGFAEF